MSVPDAINSLARSCIAVVISGEVGLRKPEPAIYRLALERLGVAAPEAVFVDDAEPNVLGARMLGMRGVLHTDAASTRAALAALIPALATEVEK